MIGFLMPTDPHFWYWEALQRWDRLPGEQFRWGWFACMVESKVPLPTHGYYEFIYWAGYAACEAFLNA